MTASDDLSTASKLQAWAGRAVASAIRAVRATSSVATEPADLAEALGRSHPAIIAMWHGQFMLVPVMSPKGVPVRTVVARHGDAEILAELLRTFDISLIRGAGSGHRKRDRGGVHLLRAAITALADGYMVPMTADVPPGPARRAGLGIVTMARLSGRPIVPFAVASSRYLSFNTWSRLTFNLPFSRIGACLGDPIHVPKGATADELEGYRVRVQEAMDAATLSAYRLACAEPLRATPPAARVRMGGPAKPAPDVKLSLYRAATSAVRPLLPFILERRAAKGKEDRERRGERFGIASATRPEGALVWLHAASVGETMTVLPVIDGLARARPDLSFLLTTGTVTSARLVESRSPARCVHQYVPLDASAYVGRFLDFWRPDMAVLTESEIWPNLVLETSARAVPIAVVNARMSKGSYRGWAKRRESALALFSRFDLVLAQNGRIADWFTDLGARAVIDTGNLKMDAPALPIDAAARAALSEAIGARPVWLAASTHAGEETLVARAHLALKSEFPGLLTVIAPRHPERGAELAARLAQLGAIVRQRSAGELPDGRTDIYLADTIGELGILFSLSPLCLMGGSLVQHGGQNPIEAVKHGCGVLTGPHTTNFADTYQALLESKAARRIGDAEALQAAVRELLEDRVKLEQMQARARTVVTKMSGALARTVTALETLLPPVETRTGTVRATPSLAPIGAPALPAPHQPGLRHAD